MRKPYTTRPKARIRPYVELLEDRVTPATLPSGFTETAIATGLTSATAMELAPNGDLWVLEQGGAIKRFQAGSTTADLVGNISGVGLTAGGERGLLGIAFDPNYAANKWIYLYYTSTDAPNPHNRVSRFTVNDSVAGDYSLVDTTTNTALLDEVEILNLDPLSSATNHNGGAIHFGPDGKLYVAVGDNANGDNAQNINNRHGKILRINADGSIPDDNPTSIAGIMGTTSGLNRAIWAAGLRNPYTFTFQPGTGVMHINDVGQDRWEEINVGGVGRNFGWPGTEGNFTQSSFPDFTRPLYAYSHGGTTFEQGFAITGGAFYNPSVGQFPGEYVGDYFYADFVNSWINVINADGSGVRRFATGAAGVLDLRVANDGSLIYLARDAGQAFRVTSTVSSAPMITQQPQGTLASVGGQASFNVAASGTAPLAYQWQKLNGTTWQNLANSNGVSGATSATLTLTGIAEADAGDYRAVVTNSAGSAVSNAATLTVTTSQPPSADISIDSGLTSGKFVAGQQIAFSGTASDPEDGTLGASAFTWQVDYITSIASGNPVVRPFVPAFNGAAGGTFTPATTGPYTLTDVAYRITLTVRDSAGLTTTRTLDVTPNVANITVRSNPAGLTLTVDGQPRADGTVIPSVVGFERPLGAAATQNSGGSTYTFQSWSDGGAATHTISTPAVNTTYTANYQLSAPSGDAFEDNDSFTGARALSAVDQTYTNLSIHATNDDDYYTIVPTVSGTMTVSLSFLNSQGDIDLDVYNAARTRLGRSESVGNAEQLNIAVTAGQTYYIRAFGFNGAVNPNYSMSINVPDPPPPPPAPTPGDYYFSTSGGGTLASTNGGASVTFADADILKLTVQTNGQFQYQLHFDGSDVGLSTNNEDIDAFAFLADGSILISTVGGFSVPTAGGGTLSGNDEDILRFVPTSLGATTAGQWSMYFDGSDVGLSASSENIDAVAVLPDGRLLISTTGSVSVPGVSGADEDLLAFTPTSLGTTTAGSWALYFDGSDVGLSTNDNEDISALYVRPTSGQPTLFFSTLGAFSVTGASGANEDAFAFTPTSLGTNTAGTFGPGLAFDGSLYGLASFSLDGIHLGPLPTAGATAAQSTSVNSNSASGPSGLNRLSALFDPAAADSFWSDSDNVADLLAGVRRRGWRS